MDRVMLVSTINHGTSILINLHYVLQTQHTLLQSCSSIYSCSLLGIYQSSYQLFHFLHQLSPWLLIFVVGCSAADGSDAGKENIRSKLCFFVYLVTKLNILQQKFWFGDLVLTQKSLLVNGLGTPTLPEDAITSSSRNERTNPFCIFAKDVM